eukprot:scaffold2048_cov204-Alexandrium_tamarense.AAC.6
MTLTSGAVAAHFAYSSVGADGASNHLSPRAMLTSFMVLIHPSWHQRYYSHLLRYHRHRVWEHNRVVSAQHERCSSCFTQTDVCNLYFSRCGGSSCACRGGQADKNGMNGGKE